MKTGLLESLNKVGQLLESVITELEAAETMARMNKDYPMVGSIRHYIMSIKEILSTDNDQAGLHPFLKKMNKEDAK